MGAWEWTIAAIATGITGTGLLYSQNLSPANTPAPSPLPITNSQLPIPSTVRASRQFKIKVTVTSLSDLKVREGDQVSVGQILADRTTERNRLQSARSELIRSLQKLEATKILEPPAPRQVPAVQKLPEARYAEEIAAIAQAKLRLAQTQQQYANQQASLREEPAGESAAVEKARAAVAEQARQIDIQQVKIERIKDLRNLPRSVAEHEDQILIQMQAELQRLESEFRLAQGRLEDIASDRGVKLQQLFIEVEQAKAAVSLAESRLETARGRRAYQEYQYSLDQAKRVEEENQAQQYYNTQLQRFAEAQRDKDFQIANLKSKIQEIDTALAQLGTIRAPISGVIRRVKNLGQTNLAIDFELSIVNSNGTIQPPNSDRIPNPTSSPRRASGASRI